MHIVTTSSQIVNVIPRAEVASMTLELRDEQTKVTTTKAVTGSDNGNFWAIDLDFTAQEDNFYTFKLKDGSTLLYYGILFCTNQTDLDAYKITEGEYTSPTTNNDYTFA